MRENDIEWHNHGKGLRDVPTAWKALAYNTTHPDGPLTEFDLREGVTPADFTTSEEAKAAVMDNTAATQWFEPTFKALDQAVFGNKKTLVHCQEGISRSPSLVIAYFMKRFNLLAEVATGLVSNQRKCIEPKFNDGLQAYQRALHS